MEDQQWPDTGSTVTSPVGDHLTWHQDLICPGPRCRGRIRRFPPGDLVDDGRRERRRCPTCGTSTTVPAFYLVRRSPDDPGEAPPAA